ncbi:MAG TPA: DUF2891 domain-containing protein [Streptosporangiaceae bacterium]|jgi:hypothetical protein|nr:DUF2891 domain-containing protein [Streptosporangiaceae bacterium]
MPDWNELLEQNAAAYARVAIDNIGREFPNGFYHAMSGPDDVPGLPRDVTPVFYGSYDWHSCVEMHWLLVRLLRTAREFVPADEVEATLDRQFDPGALAAEAATIVGPHSRAGRPYGWGWALMLVHEVSGLVAQAAGTDLGAAAERWQAALGPLADVITNCYTEWLPKATYPVRYGVHLNSAFGLSRALPHALDRSAAGDDRLVVAIDAAARAWFAGDRDYAASWEPSDVDFLSPALVEAELMAALLGPEQFPDWLSGFLPGIGDRSPANLFRVAIVSDSSDGQIAHLHGLNASRAWCWRRIAASLPPGDDRVEIANAAAVEHAEAALPHVVGDHYMVEHWLAAYAVLLLT